MRGLAALAVALALSGCVAQVGDDGLRATALITPIGIAVVPVYQAQPAPQPPPQPPPQPVAPPPLPGGSFRP